MRKAVRGRCGARLFLVFERLELAIGALAILARKHVRDLRLQLRHLLLRRRNQSREVVAPRRIFGMLVDALLLGLLGANELPSLAETAQTLKLVAERRVLQVLLTIPTKLLKLRRDVFVDHLGNRTVSLR